MVEPADNERDLGGMGIVGIVGGAEECGAPPVAMDVADHVPIGRQHRGSVNEARGRRLIDIRKIHRELAARLVPQDEGGRFIGERCAEVVEDRGEMLARDQSAAQVGLGFANAAIREMGGERRRKGSVKRQPGTAQDEHHTVFANRQAMPGATVAKLIERGRSPRGRDRITRSSSDQRRRGGIVGKHGHLPAAAAISLPTVTALAGGRACRGRAAGWKGLRRRTGKRLAPRAARSSQSLTRPPLPVTVCS